LFATWWISETRALWAKQFIAGKSVEEIREEGLKEMAANASAQKKGQKQQTTQSPTKPPLATLKSTPPSIPSM
jgi:hypothetical protein